jgi:hypothetical protein
MNGWWASTIRPLAAPGACASASSATGELALLFRLPTDGGALRLVWSGLGNTRESRLEYCLIEGIATFQLVDDKTLERQIRITSNVNRETKLPRARARELEKKCVATPQDPQRFAITP